MAFPVIEEITASAENAPVTSHDFLCNTLVNAGDLLVAVCGLGRNATDTTYTITDPADWTREIFKQNTTAGENFPTLYVVAKEAVGDEDSDIITFTNSGTAVCSVVQLYRYQVGTHNGVAGIFSASADGGVGDANPNPPDLNPGLGAQDFGWLAVGVYDDAVAAAISSYPASYTNGTNTEATDVGVGMGIGTARRDLNAASENPGIFTLDGAQQWIAATIGIQPAIAVALPHSGKSPLKLLVTHF